MCRKRKKDTQQNKDGVKNPVIRHWYDDPGSYLKIMIVFISLSLFFTCFHFFFGVGLLTQLILWFPCCPFFSTMYESMSPVLSVKAILEVGKTIGLSSVLIAWIYASLDKKESGFFYSELLFSFFRMYTWSVVLHFVSLLLCLWTATIGWRDVAFCALLVVVFGCIPQWLCLKTLILFTDRRRALAEKHWTERIKWAGERGELAQIRLDLIKLADVISLDSDGNYELLLRCYVRALRVYWNLHTEEKQARLFDLKNVLDRLLASRSKNERNLMIEGILRSLEKAGGESELSGEIRFAMCASLVLCLCTIHANQGTGRAGSDKNYSSILTAVCDDLTMLEQSGSFRKMQDARKLLRLCFTLLVWMQLLCGRNDSIDRRLFLLTPEEPFTVEESWLKAFVDAHFIDGPTPERDKKLQTAINQIRLASRQPRGQIQTLCRAGGRK